MIPILLHRITVTALTAVLVAAEPCTLTISHAMQGSPYTLRYAYSLRYKGDTENPLTNGNIEDPGCTATTLPAVWNGFHGVDLDMALKIRKNKKFSKVEVRFLDLPGSRIFAPEQVYLYTGQGKHRERMKLESEVTREERVAGGSVVIHHFKLRSEGMKHLSLQAVNKGVCPPDHPDAGQTAWLFCDEVIFR
ncbi:MAG TPA: hypothetical protein P5228_04425 [Bacteroidales bacterium]|nr:hypothetical protein [Bacteroidales bacterium]HRZ48833.1 hypothetical protein [Bacteroidales bacterium]